MKYLGMTAVILLAWDTTGSLVNLFINQSRSQMAQRTSLGLRLLALASLGISMSHSNTLQALEGHWHKPEAAREFHNSWTGWQNPKFITTLEQNKKSIVSVSGCTGTLISQRGHILTNYGCMLKEIANISNPDMNYLQDGIQSTSLQDAPIIDIKVDQILSTRDVSIEILRGVEGLPAHKRADRIRVNKERLESSCQTQGNLSCTIRTVADGLEYQLTLSRHFDKAAVRYTPPLSRLFKDHNPTFLQGTAPEKATFSILQLFETNTSSSEKVGLKVQSFVKLSRTEVKVGDDIYALGYSIMYMRGIPKYWVDVNLNTKNSRLDEFYDYAKLKQKYLNQLTFASEQNLIELYPQLGSMNNWLWRLQSGRYGKDRERENRVYRLEIAKATELENFIRMKNAEDYDYIKRTFDQLAKYDKEGNAGLVYSHLDRIKVYQQWLQDQSDKPVHESLEKAVLSDAISLVAWLQVLDKMNLIKKDSPMFSFLLEAKKHNISYFQSRINDYYRSPKDSDITKVFAAAKSMKDGSSEKQFDESDKTWPILQKWKREFLLTKSLPYYPSVNKRNIIGMTLGVVKEKSYGSHLPTSFASDLDLGFRNSQGAPTFNTKGELIGMYFTTDHVKSLYLNHYYDATIVANYHFSAVDILDKIDQSPRLKTLTKELR